MVFRDLLFKLLVVNSLLLSVVFADKNYYSFWARHPDDGSSIDVKDQPRTNKEFGEMLGKDAEKDSFHTVRSKHIGKEGSTWYWIASIDDSIVDKYKKLEVLEIVLKLKDAPLPAAKSSEKRQSRQNRRIKRDIKEQDEAPKQLGFLSLPKGGQLGDTTKYRYDEHAGKGVRVYVLDTGLNFDSTEWMSEDKRKAPDILHAGWPTKKPKDDLDVKTGHGTCMADLAVGRVNGVAKEADLTAVRIDDTSDDLHQRSYLEAHLEGIALAFDDIIDKKLQNKAVILMSFGILAPTDATREQAFETNYLQILDNMAAEGVSVVLAVPNVGQCAPGVWPCDWSDPGNEGRYVESIISVASALINDASQANPVTDSWVTIYGPGDDRSGGAKRKPGLDCLDSSKDQNSNVGQGGSSHAAAMVAGLMAYYQSLDLTAEDARKRLLDDAYVRVENGPKIAYNGAG